MNPGCGSVSARVVRPSARVSYDAGEVRRARVRARDGGVCAVSEAPAILISRKKPLSISEFRLTTALWSGH